MLNISPVIFDKELHNYTFEGTELSGVTTLLRRQMFVDMYANVPSSVLMRKAGRGTKIHEELENYDTIGISSGEEYMDGYLKFLTESKLKHVASEYLVSDLEHVASSIDKVYQDEDGYVLVDVKTTSQLHVDYVRWQLSIYKYLFELQNEGIEAKKIGVLWLNKGKWVYRLLEPFSAEEVKDLIETDARGEKYVPAIVNYPEMVLAVEEQTKIVQVLNAFAELKEKEKEIRDTMLELMKTNGCKKFDCDLFSITYVDPTERTSVDSKKLKEEYPLAYNSCLKVSKVAESVKIKVK